MTGKLSGFTFNKDGTQNITVTINEDFSEVYDELKDSDVSVDIKKYSMRRSLDASARAWVLIDQIAEKTGEKKINVYRNAIRDIGGVSDILCMKDCAVETFCRNWASKGQGWMAEHRPSKNWAGYSVVTVWYGSSVYSAKQMSALIDSLIQDANAIGGIPTMSPKEQERLINSWDRKVKKNEEKHSAA